MGGTAGRVRVRVRVSVRVSVGALTAETQRCKSYAKAFDLIFAVLSVFVPLRLMPLFG
jgi:hypothetical protein